MNEQQMPAALEAALAVATAGIHRGGDGDPISALHDAILAALAAAKEEGRREEREACAQTCAAYSASPRECADRIRARSVRP